MSKFMSLLQRAWDRTLVCSHGDWVDLAQSPDSLSTPTALLLCELPDERSWIAWVPDFGELVITLDQIVA